MENKALKKILAILLLIFTVNYCGVAGGSSASGGGGGSAGGSGTGGGGGSPTGVSASPGNGVVTVSWSTVSGATSYNVYRSNSTGTTVANGEPVFSATTPYVNSGLTNGTAYYYIVTAVDSSGESTASSEVNATPQSITNAPTGVSASPGDSTNTISWNPVVGAISYNLYWRSTSGVTIANGTPIQNVTAPYTHSGQNNGTTYYYIVTAVNGSGESSASAQVSATPQVTAAGAPTGVSVSAGNGTTTISWTPVSGATSYRLYWGTTTGVTTASTQIPNISSPYIHNGRTNGLTYYYVVTAMTGASESATSAEINTTPQISAPIAPTGITATADNTQVSIAWSAVAGATSYNIYWGNANGVTTTNGTKIAGVTSPYIHSGLTNGMAYYYIVTAVNAGGESSVSAQVNATPFTPIGTRAKTMVSLNGYESYLYSGANDNPVRINSYSDIMDYSVWPPVVLFSAVGPDTLRQTADDILTGYIVYTYNVSDRVTKIVQYSNYDMTGAPLSSPSIIYAAGITYDGYGNMTGYTYYNGPGSDGIWFNSDDNVLGSMTNTYTLDTNGHPLTKIINGSWSKQCETYTPLDGNGNPTQIVYSDAGVDSTCFTGDDVIYYYQTQTMNIRKEVTSSVSYGPGIDGIWFTPDDLANSCSTSTADLNGNLTNAKSYSTGPDALPFTPDDTLESETVYEVY